MPTLPAWLFPWAKHEPTPEELAEARAVFPGEDPHRIVEESKLMQKDWTRDFLRNANSALLQTNAEMKDDKFRMGAIQALKDGVHDLREEAGLQVLGSWAKSFAKGPGNMPGLKAVAQAFADAVDRPKHNPSQAQHRIHLPSAKHQHQELKDPSQQDTELTEEQREMREIAKYLGEDPAEIQKKTDDLHVNFKEAGGMQMAMNGVPLDALTSKGQSSSSTMQGLSSVMHTAMSQDAGIRVAHEGTTGGVPDLMSGIFPAGMTGLAGLASSFMPGMKGITDLTHSFTGAGAAAGAAQLAQMPGMQGYADVFKAIGGAAAQTGAAIEGGISGAPTVKPQHVQDSQMDSKAMVEAVQKLPPQYRAAAFQTLQNMHGKGLVDIQGMQTMTSQTADQKGKANTGQDMLGSFMKQFGGGAAKDGHNAESLYVPMANAFQTLQSSPSGTEGGFSQGVAGLNNMAKGFQGLVGMGMAGPMPGLGNQVGVSDVPGVKEGVSAFKTGMKDIAESIAGFFSAQLGQDPNTADMSNVAHAFSDFGKLAADSSEGKEGAALQRQTAPAPGPAKSAHFEEDMAKLNSKFADALKDMDLDDDFEDNVVTDKLKSHAQKMVQNNANTPLEEVPKPTGVDEVEESLKAATPTSSPVADKAGDSISSAATPLLNNVFSTVTGKDFANSGLTETLKSLGLGGTPAVGSMLSGFAGLGSKLAGKLTQSDENSVLANSMAATSRIVGNRLQTTPQKLSGAAPMKIRPSTLPFTACCCTAGKCSGLAVGSRGFEAQTQVLDSADPLYNADTEEKQYMCCLEHSDHCRSANQMRDYAKCYPDYLKPAAHVCKGGSGIDWEQSHSWLQHGDDGCLELLEPDGSFPTQVRQVKYGKIDCPFPESTEEAKRRRALLVAFTKHKPASTLDMYHSCNIANANALRIAGSLWESTLEHVQDFLSRHDSDQKRRFVCETLRLAPLMFSRISLAGGTGLRDEVNQDLIAYPKSFAGQVQGHSAKESKMSCKLYVEFTLEESTLSRRVLRALVPTWGVHTFRGGDDKDDTGLNRYLKSISPSLSASNATAGHIAYDFQDEVKRECEREEDSTLVQTPLPLLQSPRVMDRDVTTCRQPFPCRLFQPSCQADGKSKDPFFDPGAGCACACVASTCQQFTEDFAKALKNAARMDSCNKRRASSFQIM